jgi:hypothetical protein
MRVGSCGRGPGELAQAGRLAGRSPGAGGCWPTPGSANAGYGGIGRWAGSLAGSGPASMFLDSLAKGVPLIDFYNYTVL